MRQLFCTLPLEHQQGPEKTLILDYPKFPYTYTSETCANKIPFRTFSPYSIQVYDLLTFTENKSVANITDTYVHCIHSHEVTCNVTPLTD